MAKKRLGKRINSAGNMEEIGKRAASLNRLSGELGSIGGGQKVRKPRHSKNAKKKEGIGRRCFR